MMLLRRTQFNTSSKDAMTVAPCSCPANNETNIETFSGIAVAMSVLLCFVISIINALDIIMGIIILSILLICGKRVKEKAVDNLI